ncbi:MAG: hypothetical protein ACXW1Y_02265 [Acidimicrobiia bacterium]
MRTRIVLLLAALLIVSTASPAAAGPKPDVDKDVELTNYETAAIVAGDSAWIALNWVGGGGDAQNFQLVVKKPDAGVEVRYPDNTGTYTSLWADSTLSDGEYDFTAIRVTVPYDAGRDIKLLFTLSYDHAGGQKNRSFNVRVPVVEYAGGEDLKQVTESLGEVALGESAWVGVSYAGVAPRLDDFQLTVTDAGGLSIVYPADGSATSLHHNARLEDGETDVARFRVDAYGVGPGTYTIQIQAKYRKDATTATLAGSVTLVVVTPAG